MSAPPQRDLADVDQVTFANLERHDQRVRVCPDRRTCDVTSRALVGLTNDMHPAFEASRFLGGGFSLEDTLQARRFASRLLEADCSIRFWWALMFGQVMADPGLTDRQAKAFNIRMYPNVGYPVSQSEIDDFILSMNQARTPNDGITLSDPPPSESTPEVLTRSQIAQTKVALRDLAQNMHYVVREDPNGSGCLTFWFLRAGAPFRGSPSELIISAETMRKYSAAMEGDFMRQIWASISLGFTLLRLLSHAAFGAARSGVEVNWNPSYRFDADPYVGAEIRMLEACTFGGVLRREQEHESVAKSHYILNGEKGVRGLLVRVLRLPWWAHHGPVRRLGERRGRAG